MLFPFNPTELPVLVIMHHTNSLVVELYNTYVYMQSHTSKTEAKREQQRVKEEPGMAVHTPITPALRLKKNEFNLDQITKLYLRKQEKKK